MCDFNFTERVATADIPSLYGLPKQLFLCVCLRPSSPCNIDCGLHWIHHHDSPRNRGGAMAAGGKGGGVDDMSHIRGDGSLTVCIEGAQ